MRDHNHRTRHWRGVVRVVLALLAVLALVSAAYAGKPAVEDQIRQVPVSYLTTDMVYLSGGSTDGLAPGDTGIVRRNDSIIAFLDVAHVASHSSSCRILDAPGVVLVGDTVHVRTSPKPVGAPIPSDPASLATDSPSTHTVAPLESKEQDHATRVNGVVSVRASHFVSSPGVDRDYTLSSIGLNLRARDLWGRNLELVMRTSGRGNHRSSPAGTSRLDSDWSGRISTLSLAYASERSGTSLQAGRVSVNRLGRLGAIDGLVIDQALSEYLHAGLFAGVQPRWQYADGRLATQRAGGYVGWRRGDRKGTMVDLTAGAAGEYHHGTASREVILLQGRVSNARWSLNHSAEVDVNRGWRRDNAGRAMSVSGVYLSARYRAATWLSGNVSYDSRRDYWTYETRSLADSLFDDNLRQGLRAQADISLPGRSTATLGMGYRNRGGDTDPTISYTAGLRSSIVGAGRLSLSLLGTGFDGPTESGYDLSSRVSSALATRVYADLGAGYYAYKSTFTDSVRDNRWVEGVIRSTLSARLVASLGYRYSVGDDLSGHRLDAGLTLPF